MTSSGTATAPVQAYPLSIRVAIEGLGSFFIVLAGLGTALFSASGSGTTVGFAYGLAMVAAIISFGHITNGYFNPAFSLGMAVAGRLKYSAMVLYIVAQTVGALLASVVWLAMMKVMPAGATPDTAKLFGALANGFDSHSPSQVPMVGVLIVEIVLVALLTAMILGVTSPRNKTSLGPVAIGLAFAVAVGITMPLSNGSLNPARATSIVFLAESWAAGQLWLFWLAPLVGAALAAAIFRAFSPSVHADGAELTHDAGTPAPAPVAVASSATLAKDPVEAGDASDEDEDDDDDQGAAPAKPVAASDDAKSFFDGPGK
ncbi:aquaporin [Arthrobacter sp. LAPM80]|uniref:aquaporin n=1 Tax=Arthrobacter sp. LAPM80 TaxID=3141788 RepID=UPI00398B8F9B